MPRKLSNEQEIAIYLDYCTRARPDHEVAAAAGIARSTLYRLVKRVNAQLAPQLAAEVAHRKADVHHTLMGILHRAAAGWERSVGVVVTVREEPVLGSGGRPLKGVKRRIVTRRPDPGDPAFLTEMRGALADLRRLWGMDSPTKVEVEDMPTQMEIGERMKAINDRIERLLPPRLLDESEN